LKTFVYAPFRASASRIAVCPPVGERLRGNDELPVDPLAEL
jgi:hypothetical protein